MVSLQYPATRVPGYTSSDGILVYIPGTVQYPVPEGYGGWIKMIFKKQIKHSCPRSEGTKSCTQVLLPLYCYAKKQVVLFVVQYLQVCELWSPLPDADLSIVSRLSPNPDFLFIFHDKIMILKNHDFYDSHICS